MENKIQRMYKIRNKLTGLYSTGGTYPGWSKGGKLWKRKGDLASHFTILGNLKAYKDAEIVEVVLSTVETNIQSIADWQAESKARQKARELADQTRIAAWRLETARKEIDRLQKIIDNGGVK